MELPASLVKTRTDRAISSMNECLDCDKPDRRMVLEAVTRIVIATNSFATQLHAHSTIPDARQLADLLWSIGEGLGISADGHRG